MSEGNCKQDENEGENQEQNAPIQASPDERRLTSMKQRTECFRSTLVRTEEADQPAEEEFNQQTSRKMSEQEFAEESEREPRMEV